MKIFSRPACSSRGSADAPLNHYEQNCCLNYSAQACSSSFVRLGLTNFKLSRGILQKFWTPRLHSGFVMSTTDAVLYCAVSPHTGAVLSQACGSLGYHLHGNLFTRAEIQAENSRLASPLLLFWCFWQSE